MDEDAFEKKFNTLEVDFIRSQQMFCQKVLKLSPGQQAVISNGRVSARLWLLNKPYISVSVVEWNLLKLKLGHGWLTLHTHCLCVMWLSEFADRIRVDRADDWCSRCSGADREKCRGQPLIENFIILHLSTAVARLCSIERKATERR